MPFDATPDAEVTARDRMIRLRDFLAGLPEERFKMHLWECEYDCGTVACIAGWQGYLTGERWGAFDRDETKFIERMGRSLGLSPKQADQLFMPDTDGLWNEVTKAHALAVLDHYLATGKIDWSVA